MLVYLFNEPISSLVLGSTIERVKPKPIHNNVFVNKLVSIS